MKLSDEEQSKSVSNGEEGNVHPLVVLHQVIECPDGKSRGVVNSFVSYLHKNMIMLCRYEG